MRLGSDGPLSLQEGLLQDPAHRPAEVLTHCVPAEAGQFRQLLEAGPRRDIEVTEIPGETHNLPLTGSQPVIRLNPSSALIPRWRIALRLRNLHRTPTTAHRAWVRFAVRITSG